MLAQVLLNSPRSLPVAVVAALAVVVAVFWLYPAQVREVRWYWRWVLPGLRAAGMLALAAALLKPAVMRPKTADERGAVLVLVDRSRSMAVADNARTPAQLVALAEGMGRLAPGVRSGGAAAVAARAAEARPLLAEAERAFGDLDYARVAGRGVEGARRRVDDAAARLAAALEALRKAADAVGDATVRERLAAVGEPPAAEAGDPRRALADLRAGIDAAGAGAAQAQAAADERLYKADAAVRAACDELGRLSRFQLVEQALLRPGGGLLAKLGAGARVVGYGVAEGLTPLALPMPSSVDPSAAGPATAPATGPTSAPAAPALALQPDGRRSDLVGGVRAALEVAGGGDVAAVVLLSDGRQTGGQAVVTSGLGASGAPVYAVSAAPPAAVRDVAFGKVSVPASAFVGETVTVRAEVRPLGVGEAAVRVTAAVEGGAAQAQTVAVRDGKPAVAEFRLKLERPGAQAVELGLGPVEGETTAENNRERRWVKVLSQKVKVGAFAALPGWDFQYLRNALARTGWVELRAGVLNGAGARLPVSAEEILGLDVLVLGDVSPASLDDSQWSAAYRLISERGGSVVLLAGPANVPGAYGQHLVASYFLPYAAELTPTWRMWPGEEPLFRLVPHPDAAAEPALRLDGGGDAGGGARRWQALPGFFRVLPVGRLKPSARALLVEASSGEPVLTENRVGAGRSFLLGADETWRWRAAGEEVHDRFWLQLIRHAAGEPYAVRSERLALDVNRVAFDAGEVAQAKVRTVGDGGAANLRLEVMRDGKAVRTVPIGQSDGGDAGRFRGTVGPLPAGDYELRLSESGAAEAALSLPLHVTAGYEAELADVSADESVLRRLADASGGELCGLEAMDQLSGRLEAATARGPRYVEQRLWDSPYLFVFVVACFAAEWAARKRLGLA